MPHAGQIPFWHANHNVRSTEVFKVQDCNIKFSTYYEAITGNLSFTVIWFFIVGGTMHDLRCVMLGFWRMPSLQIFRMTLGMRVPFVVRFTSIIACRPPAFTLNPIWIIPWMVGIISLRVIGMFSYTIIGRTAVVVSLSSTLIIVCVPIRRSTTQMSIFISVSVTTRRRSLVFIAVWSVWRLMWHICCSVSWFVFLLRAPNLGRFLSVDDRQILTQEIVVRRVLLFVLLFLLLLRVFVLFLLLLLFNLYTEKNRKCPVNKEQQSNCASVLHIQYSFPGRAELHASVELDANYWYGMQSIEVIIIIIIIIIIIWIWIFITRT